MSKRTRRSFTPEFRAQAVDLVRTSGSSIGKVARDLDLTETALRAWVRAAEGKLSPKPSNEDDHAELLRLRDENRVLRMERDFLKKAAAFFARESK